MEDFSFIGRAVFIDELLEQIEGGSALLEGARGVGKTALLRQLERHPPAGWAVLRFDLQGVENTSQLVQRFADHVSLRRSTVQDFVSELLGGWRRDEPWESLERLLCQRLRGKTLVLLDEVQIYLDLLSRQDRSLALRELGHLNRVRRLSDDQARFILTGSISLRAVAAGLGGELSPDWRQLRLRPLDAPYGSTLFEHHYSCTCDEEAPLLGHQLAGGLPRWIERLASATPRIRDRKIGTSDVREGMKRLLKSRPFAGEIKHFERHGAPEVYRHALWLAAQSASSEVAVIAGLQQKHRMQRSAAQQVLTVLQDEFYLDDEARHTLPLFGEWLRTNP